MSECVPLVTVAYAIIAAFVTHILNYRAEWDVPESVAAGVLWPLCFAIVLVRGILPMLSRLLSTKVSD